MLYELAIENFKPFSNRQVAPLSKITLIYGPNSGGKSSLIQALMLLRQTFEAQGLRSAGLIARGKYVDLGSFRSLIHRHEVSRVLSLSLAYDRVIAARNRTLLALPRDQSRRTTLSFRARGTGRFRNDSSELVSVRYELDEGRLLDTTLVKVAEQSTLFAEGETGLARNTFQWADVQSRNSYAQYLGHFDAMHREPSSDAAHRRHQSTSVSPAVVDVERTANGLARSLATGWGLLPVRLVPANREEPVDAVTQRFRHSQPLERLAGEFNLLLESFAYLGPLRSHPARHYLVTGGPTDTVGVTGESAPQVLYRAPREVSSELNAWLDRFEIPYRMKVKSIGDELEVVP